MLSRHISFSRGFPLSLESITPFGTQQWIGWTHQWMTGQRTAVQSWCCRCCCSSCSSRCDSSHARISCIKRAFAAAPSAPPTCNSTLMEKSTDYSAVADPRVICKIFLLPPPKFSSLWKKCLNCIPQIAALTPLSRGRRELGKGKDRISKTKEATKWPASLKRIERERVNNLSLSLSCSGAYYVKCTPKKSLCVTNGGGGRCKKTCLFFDMAGLKRIIRNVSGHHHHRVRTGSKHLFGNKLKHRS